MKSTPALSTDDILVLGACTAALATLTPVALYQTGVIDHLPDPPGRLFDSERITMSAAAHPLGIPDALLGLASFGATLALAFKAHRSPFARTLLGAKLTLDVAAASVNATRQVVSFGKLCSWCTGTAIAAGLMGVAGRGSIAGTWKQAASLLPGHKTSGSRLG